MNRDPNLILGTNFILGSRAGWTQAGTRALGAPLAGLGSWAPGPMDITLALGV